MPLNWLRVVLALVLTLFTTQVVSQQKTGSNGGSAIEGITNKLLAPGPLMIGHQDLEHKDCLSCHEANSGVPDKKCLTCHKEIVPFVKAKKGLHGRTKEPCFKCHSDHKGRDLDSTKVNEKTFDHAQTGFLLTGAHARIECRECHTKTRATKKIRPTGISFLRDSVSSCRTCHNKDDVHFFTGKFAKKDCASCHNDRSWKEASAFNHKSETGYELKGKHAELTCAKCHTPKGKASARYDWPLETKKCLSCHEDFHKNNLSQRFKNGSCDKCHSETTWKITNFDHKVTGFELKGRHRALNCVECHKTNKGKHETKSFDFKGLNKNCTSCHEDYHGFFKQVSQVGKGPLAQCLRCHNEEDWKFSIAFEHNRDTKYPIDGKHIGLSCFKCHKPNPSLPKMTPPARIYHFKELAVKSCETCHKNPHPRDFLQRFGNAKCESCHTTAGWGQLAKMNQFFNHDKTRFPLTGDHKNVKCDSCHKVEGKSQYKFKGFEKKFCITCHENIHVKQFSKRIQTTVCSDCHNTTDFAQITQFDHNKTRFKIDGDHVKLEKDCVKCHVKTEQMLPTKPPKPAGKFLFAGAKNGFCEDCHRNVHEKQFHEKFSKRPCVTCHNTNDFWPIKQFNHDETEFKLTGAHAKVQQCADCHKLTHNRLPVNPPKQARQFIFPGKERGFCENCHNNVHEQQFTPEFVKRPCNECHGVVKFWPIKPFDHDKTDFKLTGKHAELAKQCEKCHVKTSQMLPTEPPKPAGKFRFNFANRGYCEECHKNVHDNQFTPKFAKTACAECHSTKAFWPIKSFDHDTTRFKLAGKHKEIEKKCTTCHVKTENMLDTDPPKPAGKFQFEGVKEGFCESCHANEHKQQFKPKFYSQPCVNCHNQDTFTKRKPFKHSTTAFVLKGKHQQVECKECHVKTESKFKQAPQNFKGRYLFSAAEQKACTTCHKDPHQGEFGKDCASCHNEKSWQLPTNYHKGFLLKGVHFQLECAECHQQSRRLEGQSDNCQYCHLKDDPHLGGIPNCKDCHTQTMWNQTTWHHSRTSFPVRGAHRTLDCAACHFSGTYQGLPLDCAGCHFKDAAQVASPVHTGPTYEVCSSCHNEFSFQGTRNR